MGHRITRIVFCTVLGLAALGLGTAGALRPADAEWGTPVPPGGSVAVSPAWLYVVGIDDYEHVRDLDTPVADAHAFRDLLLEKFQFDAEYLRERYDGEATRENLIEDLRWFAGHLTPDDSLLIYYAGHGKEDDVLQNGYWIPTDGEQGKVSSWVSNSDIRDALVGVKARHIWLISDSCFSGTLLNQRDVGDVIDQRYYAEKYRIPSRQVFASAGEEPAADGGRDGHSVFGYYLLRYLERSSAPYITPSELAAAVSRTVSNNSWQTPVFGPIRAAGDEGGEFVLVNRRAAPQESEIAGALEPDGTRSIDDPDPSRADGRGEHEIDPGGSPRAGLSPSAPVEDLVTGPDSILTEIGYRLVILPPGTFVMGSSGAETGRDDDELAHVVTLTRSLAMGSTEVTQALWEAVMGENPSRHTDPDGPVDSATWLEAVRFCNELSRIEGLDPAYTLDGETARWDRKASGYRLPTEAEWEYAARAGEATLFSGAPLADEVAWTSVNSGGRPAPVATLAPNAWGLYDMSGNVWEWATDGRRIFSTAPRRDPLGPFDDRYRVLRGGCWNQDTTAARVANRYWEVLAFRSDRVGLRIARTLE